MSKYLVIVCDDAKMVDWLARQVMETLRYSNKSPKLLGVADDSDNGERAYDRLNGLAENLDDATVLEADYQQ